VTQLTSNEETQIDSDSEFAEKEFFRILEENLPSLMNDRSAAYAFIKQHLGFYLEYYNVKNGGSQNQSALVVQLTQAVHSIKQELKKLNHEN
jgi:hypothetical protein